MGTQRPSGAEKSRSQAEPAAGAGGGTYLGPFPRGSRPEPPLRGAGGRGSRPSSPVRTRRRELGAARPLRRPPQPPSPRSGAVPGSWRSAEAATDPNRVKAGPGEGLSPPGPRTGRCSALAAAGPAFQALAPRHGDGATGARRGLKTAPAQRQGPRLTTAGPPPSSSSSSCRRRSFASAPRASPHLSRCRGGPAKPGPRRGSRPLGAATFPRAAAPQL